jgi:hypothetical protein
MIALDKVTKKIITSKIKITKVLKKLSEMHPNKFPLIHKKKKVLLKKRNFNFLKEYSRKETQVLKMEIKILKL